MSGFNRNDLVKALPASILINYSPSIAIVNTMTKATWVRTDLFQFTLAGPSLRKDMAENQAGTEAEIMEELSGSSTSGFLAQLQTAYPGWQSLQWAGPSHISQQLRQPLKEDMTTGQSDLATPAPSGDPLNSSGLCQTDK